VLTWFTHCEHPHLGYVHYLLLLRRVSTFYSRRICAEFRTIFIPPPVSIGPFVRNFTQNLFPNRFFASFCAQYQTKSFSGRFPPTIWTKFHTNPRSACRVSTDPASGNPCSIAATPLLKSIQSSASFHRSVPRLFSPSPSYRFLIGSSEHSFLRFSTFFSIAKLAIP